jgi:hypothetical protein
MEDVGMLECASHVFKSEKTVPVLASSKSYHFLFFFRIRVRDIGNVCVFMLVCKSARGVNDISFYIQHFVPQETIEDSSLTRMAQKLDDDLHGSLMVIFSLASTDGGTVTVVLVTALVAFCLYTVFRSTRSYWIGDRLMLLYM